MMVNNFSVFCDGGARGNPGPGACAFIIKNEQEKIIDQRGKYLGRTTNNVAEYSAVVEALEWIIKNQPSYQLPTTSYHFYLDSQLVVNQLNGFFKIKNALLRELVIKVRSLENQIPKSIIYHYIPRSANTKADELVNQTLNRAAIKP